MARQIFRLTLVALAFLPWSLMAKAAPLEEGVVDEVRGKVAVKTWDNQDRVIGPGVFLWSGDIVETGKDGFLRVIMSDGTLLELRANTRIEIIDSRTTKSGNPAVVVYLGRIWAWVAKNPAGGTAFECQTPTAVAGVRGTEFDLAVGIDGATRIGVDEGVVDVDADGRAVSVTKDQETTVEGDQAPRAPMKYQRSEDDWQNWVRSRQDALVKNADQILPWMLGDVKRSREGLRALREQGAQKFKALQEYARRQRLEGKQVRLSPQQRREIVTYLAQLYGSVQELQRADRRMMAKYYLLTRIALDVKQNPEAYTPEFRETIAKIMAELEKLDIAQIHQENLKIIDGYSEAIERIAERLQLGSALQRRVVGNRRADLEQARKQYREQRKGPR